jgi:hypothetical protein
MNDGLMVQLEAKAGAMWRIMASDNATDSKERPFLAFANSSHH